MAPGTTPLGIGNLVGDFEITGAGKACVAGVFYPVKHITDGLPAELFELFPAGCANRNADGNLIPDEYVQDNWQGWCDTFAGQNAVLVGMALPGIQPVWDILTTNNTVYVLMPKLDATAINRHEALTDEQKDMLFAGFAQNVSFLHEAGLWHGNLSDDMLVVNRSGEPVIKAPVGSLTPSLLPAIHTLAPGAVDVPLYPFEMWFDAGETGPWTDIYQLGVFYARFRFGKQVAPAKSRVENKSGPFDGREAPPEFPWPVVEALHPFDSQRPQSIPDWLENTFFAELVPDRAWVGPLLADVGLAVPEPEYDDSVDDAQTPEPQHTEQAETEFVPEPVSKQRHTPRKGYLKGLALVGWRILMSSLFLVTLAVIVILHSRIEGAFITRPVLDLTYFIVNENGTLAAICATPLMLLVLVRIGRKGLEHSYTELGAYLFGLLLSGLYSLWVMVLVFANVQELFNDLPAIAVGLGLFFYGLFKATTRFFKDGLALLAHVGKDGQD